MKKNVLLSLVLGLIVSATACSPDNETSQTPNVTVTKMVATNYNTTVSPYTPNDSTTFNLDSQERIVNSERRFAANSSVATTNYTYSNGKISQLEGTVNGVINSRTYYNYTANDLTEYRVESISNTGMTTNINKHTFHTVQDTIYSDWERSTNGGTSYSTILNSKMVIENGDRTFYESYDPINLQWKRVRITFDANHNPLTQTESLLINGVWTVTQVDNYTYATLKSPFYKAMEATFGRNTLSRIYHLVPGAINAVYARNIAPHCIDTYTTTWGGAGSVLFQISNTAFSPEYAKRSVINCTSGPITTSLGYNYYF
ncbi:MAG: hypothetical protein RLZZ500_492 [Bacteroidota bacterium]|jgi:hypothetical protein